ncbi:MAG: lactonase family protein [Parabacteroides sp.]
MAIGLAGMTLAGCTEKPANEHLYLWVGSYADASAEGIRMYQFDEEQGDATFLAGFTGIQDPSYQALDQEGTRLYSVSETNTPEASLCAYQINKAAQTLTRLNEQLTQGTAPCYVWIDSQCRLAVTANYNGGSISAFPIAPDGSLQPAEVFAYEGGTPDSERQDAPHLHCIYASPDEKYLFANDLGTDRIYKYELVEKDGGLRLQPGNPASFSLPAGEGPRHTVFHPNGRWAYLISELSGRVAFLRYDAAAGNLTPVQFIEADSLHAAGSADIHITPDGRFLYASNRLQGDGIAIFAIDAESGELTRTGYQLTGIHPRNFIITPNGKFLLCACRDSHCIQVFSIDAETGGLTDTGKRIETSKPVCLKFMKP